MKRKSPLGLECDSQPGASLEAWRLELALGAEARCALLLEAALADDASVPALDRLARLARLAASAPAAWVVLAHADQFRIKSVSEQGVSEKEISPYPALCARVVCSGQPLVLAGTGDDAGPTGAGIVPADGGTACVMLPIRARGTLPVGALCVADYGPRAWTGEQVEALAEVAGLIGAEIEQRAGSRVGPTDPPFQATLGHDPFQAGLLAVLGQPVITVDLGFIIRYWNRAAESLYGWSAPEAVGQPISLVIPESAHATGEEIMARLLAGETWSGEFPLVRKDRSTFPGWVTVSHLYDADGQVAGFVGISADISESKRIAERHRAFSTIGQELNAARSPREVAGVILDMADRLIGWDCSWLDICDLETQHNETIVLFDEIDGRRNEVPPPSNVLTPGCYTMRALQEGGFRLLRTPEDLDRLAREADRPLTFGDRNRPSASIMVVPIRLGARPIGALSIQSYRANAYDGPQLELLQTLADYCAGALERAEAELARDHLQEQLLQAQKMEAIGRLAGGVAHDFNNMLAVINGYSGLLLARLPPNSDVRDAVTQIGEAGRRASQLTRQLLSFSRKGLLEPMPIDLATVVHGMERMLQRLIGEDIELATVYEPLPGEILADPGQVEQVVMNLVINSRDAMPDGGKLTIGIVPAVLDSHFVSQHPEVQPGQYAHLEVRDTGVGMTECVRQRIFEPFFTTKEAGKGTGLGLSTVFAIIRQCGGCIDVESSPGGGTTFHLYFPLTEVEDEEPEAPEPELPGGGSECVLLVEDEPLVSKLVRQVLVLQGYQVLTAHTGEEALQVAAEADAPIDLLLTDVVMPGGMNGRELAERLRAERPETRVLYMSGYTDDEILRAGLRRAEVAFIHKPFAPDDLLREVRRLLDS